MADDNAAAADTTNDGSDDTGDDTGGDTGDTGDTGADDTGDGGDTGTGASADDGADDGADGGSDDGGTDGGGEGDDGDAGDGKVTFEKFTLPKGFKLEGDRLDSFKEFSNGMGFNQKEAQQVVDYFVKSQSGEMQALEDRLAQRAKDDIAAVYGWKSLQAGDGIKANVGLANTGIERLQDTINNIFGDDAISLFQHLKDRGLDTDPGITQMAYAHATTVSEDVLVKERGSPVVKKDRQDVLYPPAESG